RPFILGRSTYPSAGMVASHWFGDNNSTFPDIHDSVTSMVTFNSFFGIPHVGSDIGGFHGSMSGSDLMARWIQTGALHPFARIHSSK
ncbi:glycoside hydrolase family 31, partial [Kipferlia bialata]